ncbi:NrtA/SsuA/CpmA family ABC transporter substrate-binding protein [uncultured Mailhella sp.]|uniref:ABC transporter substrate-binding protein n=1 Tax=uncultured Mailhella sp. TaxID=1981031 RepID=UPI0026158883|nr:NrtA/SsuA/CpmA family ABC transporter substrate-binding protein [uncultured Mailhella sp.]
MNTAFRFTLACALALGLFAPAHAAEGELNISYVKSPFNLQMMVMKEHQLLEKKLGPKGITVRWHDIDSGAQQATAMASGDLDIGGVVNTTSVQIANAEGNPVIIVAAASRPTDVFGLAVQENGPKTFKELKGKTIAGPKGTVLHQLLAAGLAREGMSMNDVNFVQMGIPQGFSALMSGKVDAALIAAGALVKAGQAGKPILATATGLVTPKLVMCASGAFLKKHPELVADVVAVQDEACDWIMAHHDEAVALGAKEQNLSKEDAEKLFAWSHYAKRLNENDLKSLDEDMAFMLEQGMMRKSVDSRSFILDSAME